MMLECGGEGRGRMVMILVRLDEGRDGGLRVESKRHRGLDVAIGFCHVDV